MAAATARVRVRAAREGDVEAVRACLVAAFEAYRPAYTPAAFLDTVPDREGVVRRLREMTVLIAETSGLSIVARIVGTVGHQLSEGGVGHLRGMAVLPEFQGRGVAERLLTAAEAALAARGCARV